MSIDVCFRWNTDESCLSVSLCCFLFEMMKRLRNSMFHFDTFSIPHLKMLQWNNHLPRCFEILVKFSSAWMNGIGPLWAWNAYNKLSTIFCIYFIDCLIEVDFSHISSFAPFFSMFVDSYDFKMAWTFPHRFSSSFCFLLSLDVNEILRKLCCFDVTVNFLQSMDL